MRSQAGRCTWTPAQTSRTTLDSRPPGLLHCTRNVKSKVRKKTSEVESPTRLRVGSKAHLAKGWSMQPQGLMGSESTVNRPDSKWQDTGAIVFRCEGRTTEEGKTKAQLFWFSMEAVITGERIARDDATSSWQRQQAWRGWPHWTNPRWRRGCNRERARGGTYPDPKWQWQLRQAEGRKRQERLCPQPRWRLPRTMSRLRPAAPAPPPPRPSLRPLASYSPARAARAARAGFGHLTWRQRRRLQRRRGMGAAVAGLGPGTPAARGRRRARGPWPRRTWLSTMWWWQPGESGARGGGEAGS